MIGLALRRGTRLVPPVTRRSLVSSSAAAKNPPPGFEHDEDLDIRGPRMTEQEAKAFRDEHQITLQGKTHGIDVTPIAEFEDLLKVSSDEEAEELPRKVLNFMKTKKYTGLTPIQAQSLPISLVGRDLIGIAQTGSGKTMGFLIPLLWEAMVARRSNPGAVGPLAVVMAPTRELAQQIEAEAKPLANAFGASTICLFGGQPRHMQQRQITRLGRRLDLVVATPGRLTDFMRDHTLLLSGVRFLVLDEADRMLDMGFEPQLREVVDALPAGPDTSRQTLMFSATWPKEVRQLANDFLDEPVRINVGEVDRLVANSDITQKVQMHRTTLAKLDALSELLRSMGEAEGSRVCHSIVFANRKRDVDMIAQDVRDNTKLHTAALHGDMTQGRRDSMLASIKSGRAQVLVATDVAARGLDVKTIKQVINFDMPLNMEDYIHRIGRTGRAGAKGYAVSFMSAADAAHAPALIKILKEARQKVPAELQKMALIMGGKAGMKPAAPTINNTGGGGGGTSRKAKGLYD